jgi:hypothetical protein
MLTEVEECQQSENAPALESDHLVVGQHQVLRSSSTSDITEPLCSDSSQGTWCLQLLIYKFWLGLGKVADGIAFYIYSKYIY